MNNLFWIFLTLAAGALLPVQAGLNTRLGNVIISPVYASLISFVVGTIGLSIYVLVTRQTVSWDGVKDAPITIWMGGLLGAFYVTVIVWAFSKLGPGLTFGLIVAGQMLVSIFLEHANILVAQPSPISIYKILGVILIVAGVILVRK